MAATRRERDTAGLPSGRVGIRHAGTGVAELTRMFVRPGARRTGGGHVLLAAAEDAAVRLGARTMRLDTRHDLVAARALYAAHGYQEIPAYSHGPYADHWFEKRLGVVAEKPPSCWQKSTVRPPGHAG